jgi:DNA-binding protein H-NS
MAQIRWDKLSDVEIKGLIRGGEVELARRSAASLKLARQKIAAVAKEFGVSLNELLEGGQKRVRRTKGEQAPAKGKLPPKYANPKDPAQTWSGHGKRPDWFKRYIVRGNADDLLIGAAPVAKKPTRTKAARVAMKPAVKPKRVTRAPRRSPEPAGAA